MSVTEYLEPTGTGEAELTEKRSRFIGHIWRIDSKAEAREKIDETRARYHDARHNCWCYIVRDGGVVRYSDDGEPQGTAGQPMLEALSRMGLYNVCCVVTRYFGGVLLGPGGLIRAYTEAAKLALADAGVSQCRLWQCVEIRCAYNLFDRVKVLLEAAGGTAQEIDYAEGVTISALITLENLGGLAEKLREMSAGAVAPVVTGEKFVAVPCEGAD